MMKAELKQEMIKSVVLEAQSAAWEALAKLREAENKALTPEGPRSCVTSGSGCGTN